MTDPQRISRRTTGLAAELLRAGVGEQPGHAGMEQTLAALGVSGVVLTTTSTAAAVAAGSAKVAGVVTAGASTAKGVSAALLLKWIGIGVVGGVGLAGAASVATRALTSVHVETPTVVARPAVAAPSTVSVEPARPSHDVEAPAETAVPETAPSVVASTPHTSANVVAPSELDVGAPLAAEVAYVDRARALLAAGQTDQGLSLLQSYERQFPEARLLPEVLFLRMETAERLGRVTEAQSAAARLLEGFPQSPHAARARRLLNQ